MPYVNTRKMLLKAQSEGYAIGAFNIENMEFVQAAIEICVFKYIFFNGKINL